MALEHGLDLSQLDAEAADLHLLVSPTSKENLAGGRVAAEVTRAVHPLPEPGAWVGIGHELRRSSRRVAEIPQGQVRTAHQQFAQFPDSGQLPGGPNQQLHVHQPLTQRQDLQPAAISSGEAVVAHGPRGLGRTVGVDDQGTRRQPL